MPETHKVHFFAIGSFKSGVRESTYGEMSRIPTVSNINNGLKLPLVGFGTSQVNIKASNNPNRIVLQTCEIS